MKKACQDKFALRHRQAKGVWPLFVGFSDS